MQAHHIKELWYFNDILNIIIQMGVSIGCPFTAMTGLGQIIATNHFEPISCSSNPYTMLTVIRIKVVLPNNHLPLFTSSLKILRLILPYQNTTIPHSTLLQFLKSLRYTLECHWKRLNPRLNLVSRGKPQHLEMVPM
jgi:hypothetical protein